MLAFVLLFCSCSKEDGNESEEDKNNRLFIEWTWGGEESVVNSDIETLTLTLFMNEKQSSVTLPSMGKICWKVPAYTLNSFCIEMCDSLKISFGSGEVYEYKKPRMLQPTSTSYSVEMHVILGEVVEHKAKNSVYDISRENLP